MKLHWSPRSPFVRTVMIAAHEVGIQDSLNCVRTVVSSFKANDEIFVDNPLGKLPTLVLDDGTPVYDSRVICEYFDTLHKGPRLVPVTYPKRLTTQRRAALGNGALDLFVGWFVDILKPAKDRQEIITTNHAKAASIFRALDTEAPSLERDPFDMGHIMIGCALSYADFRLAFLEWRKGHGAIARWHDETFVKRPSVVANTVVDDL
jgi:glutathione S-transferase